jgi:conjugative relaxase-like TrwC/TraI family protein
MLTLAKLAPGSEGYYLDTVARGAEDYYVGRGEAPGTWMGRGADALNLRGVVEPEDLRQILSGTAPNGAVLGAANRTVPGFDLTFSVPKSVSVLAALRPKLSDRIVAAGEVALSRSVQWLEGNACGVRLGHNGTEALDGTGFVAAAFRHRTSRAGDPQLHWHVLVTNATQSPNGQWRSLDGARLYPALRTAGFLFEAHLRYELGRTLGVHWGPVKNGIAEIEGVAPELRRLFSKRREQIEERLAVTGYTSGRAAQAAAYATRDRKAPTEPDPTLWDRWQTEARQAGFSRWELRRATGQAVESTDPTISIPHLVSPKGLTEHASTFSRWDAVRAMCDLAPSGFTVDEAERAADLLLVSPEVSALGTAARTAAGAVRLDSGRVIGTVHRERYSTGELLNTEWRLVALAQMRCSDARPHVSRAHAVSVLNLYPTLSHEQRQAIGQLVTRDGLTDVLIAPAGSGKTFCLDVARSAWQMDGIRVIGAALSARSAKEIEEQAAIPSTTVRKLMLDLQQDVEAIDKRTVLVIDEAAMVGTRDLDYLVRRVHRGGGRVVLVGDPRQLQAIDAGGVLRGLEERLPVISLTENRRQVEGWERQALTELRAGDVQRFLRAYHRHDRIHTFDTAGELRNQLLADWHEAVVRGEDTVILAMHRNDVDELNRRTRETLIADGRLNGPMLEVGEQEFGVGDQVLMLRNHRALGLLNGLRGTVSAIDPSHGTMTVALADGVDVAVPRSYLDGGHVTHGYAMTIHKAQGMTVDRAFVLGGDDLYREAGYTALSRARTSTHLYLAMSTLREGLPELAHVSLLERTSAKIEAKWLAIERGEHLAIDHGRSLDQGLGR